MPSLPHKSLLTAIAAAALLAGCGGGSSSPESGSTDTLMSSHAVAALSTSQLQSLLATRYAGQTAAQQLIGAPQCGVQVDKFVYATVGGEGETTDASGALMLPTGAGTQCQGPRPIVVYAHGTAIDRAEDMSAINDPTNPAYASSTRVALIFAAHGYIVVAPNYAGYDVSTLPYHPYLNEAQQSQDMLDSLSAARQLLLQPGSPVSDNGKLFVTGYSEGGYVSMATLQALDAQGRPATAGAAMSGPYAMLALGDEIFLGHPNVGGTAYLPLLANSYAHLRQGSIDPSQLFSSRYPKADTLFPGTTDFSGFASLVANGDIPASALFQSQAAAPGAPGFSTSAYPSLASLPEGAPLYGAGFDASDYLVGTAFRAAYVADVDAHPDGGAPVDGSAPDLAGTPPAVAADPQLLLRQDLKANDLRNYTPSMPLLLCGGHGDPEVLWNQGAGLMTAMLRGKEASDPSLRFVTLDLDTSSGSAGTYVQYGLSPAVDSAMQAMASQVQAAFTGYQAAVDSALGPALGLEAYHTDERPYCTVEARSLFDQF